MADDQFFISDSLAQKIDNANQVKLPTEQEIADNPFWILRHYDGFDNEWIDITGAIPYAEALTVYNDRTNNGEKNAKFADIDYYCLFPADTKMLYSADRERYEFVEKDLGFAWQIQVFRPASKDRIDLFFVPKQPTPEETSATIQLAKLFWIQQQ